MEYGLPTVFVIRHGETSWTVMGRHTGRTDVPLTERGRDEARQLGERLERSAVTTVFTSPLQRASETCELAGFAGVARVDPDLSEWDYGRYEGLRSAEIRADRADWELFRDGCPEGETPAQVSSRADRVVSRVRALGGKTLLFSSGHFIRAIAARWLGLELSVIGRFLVVSTASVSVLGYESEASRPVIRSWNET